MNSELLAVFEYLERERGIDRELLIQTVEEALLAASRKSIRQTDDLKVRIDRKTYDIRALAKCRIVEKVRDPSTEVDFLTARRAHPGAHLGEVVEIEVTPRNFGRIAAQTAKQAILQKIRQAERDRCLRGVQGPAGRHRQRVGPPLRPQRHVSSISAGPRP